MKKFLIKVNGNQYEVEVEEIRADGCVVEIPSAQASQPQVSTAAPTAPKPSEPKKEVSVQQGSIKVNAPMPGTILKVNVNPGDVVKKGQVLLILEAMKMENEIVAPSDGTVVAVNVAKGASVNAGDLLVSLS